MPRRTRAKRDDLTVRGDLQAEVMTAVWELGEATVEDVRQRQPAARRGAYTTVQTVMTRLVERGLLTREKRGKGYVYRARYEQADFLSRAIGAQLAGAGAAVRRAALVNLVESLQDDDLGEVARIAQRLKRQRAR